MLLAASPNKEDRDGERALQIAMSASELVTAPDGACFDALAAAHAELGHWDEAIRAQESAVKLSHGEVRTACADRLKLYRAHQPYRLPK